jgi:hypothetical protein
MHNRLLIILLLLGLSGLACQTSGLPFFATATPTPTLTPLPTDTPFPTLTPTRSTFMEHMQECLDNHFGAGKNFAPWQPLFCDNFSHAGDWQLENYSASPGTVTKTVHENTGQLTWVVTANINNTFIDFIPMGPDKLSSFDISMREVKLDGPNSWFAMIFRYQETTTNYYAFIVDYADQSSSVWLMQNGQWTVINDWSSSPIIKKADGPEFWNTVSVHGEGTSYQCYVNNQIVQLFDDNRLPTGWVGFSVMADPNTTTTFSFDDIVLLGKQ